MSTIHPGRRSIPMRMVAILAVLGLLLAACGDDGDTAEGDTTTTTTPSDTDAPEGEDGELPAGADPDGVVRVTYDLVGAAKGGFTWDPTEVTTQLTDSGLFYLVYGALLRPTAEGELIPDLAESTDVVDDKTIEIVLREGATFSDGSPFDAEAVKAGLERSQAATDSAGFGTAFFDLETIEVVDDATLRLIVPNGTAASWHDTFLGSWETTIVKPDGDFNQPVGAGPMIVTNVTPETSITLEARDDYWDAESILVGGMELVHSPDRQANVSALGAEQVDFALIETVNIPALGSDIEVDSQINPNTLMTLMTCKRDEPLSDPLVRRALNMAVDRQAVSDAVFGGTYEPAQGLWPSGHRFHNPDVDDELAYDPDAARELLAEAGFEDGFDLDMYVLETASLPDVAAILQQQFGEIGVNVNIVPATNYVNDFLVARAEGVGLVPAMSPNRLKLLQWSGESIGNTCTYVDPEFEALEAELHTVSDTSEEAVELWHEIEAKVVEDALSIFILFGADVFAYDTESLGEAGAMPYTITVPDVRETWMKG